MNYVIETVDDVKVYLKVRQLKRYVEYSLSNSETGEHTLLIDPLDPGDIYRLATHITGYIDNVKRAVADRPRVLIDSTENVLKIDFNDGKRIYLTKKEYLSLKKEMLK